MRIGLAADLINSVVGVAAYLQKSPKEPKYKEKYRKYFLRLDPAQQGSPRQRSQSLNAIKIPTPSPSQIIHSQASHQRFLLTQRPISSIMLTTK